MSSGPGRALTRAWLLRAWDSIHWAVGSLTGSKEWSDAAYLLKKASGHCRRLCR